MIDPLNTAANPVRIVMTPEALGRCLLDPSAQPALELWRDDRIQPVVCRALLVRYLRLLHRLAVPQRVVRWWGWWLGSPAKALILPDPEPPSGPGELCFRLAVAGGAPWVVGCPPFPEPAAEAAPRWTTAPELPRLV